MQALAVLAYVVALVVTYRIVQVISRGRPS